jgi:hypothetical protein
MATTIREAASVHTPPRVELTQLTWNKENLTLISEASTLFGPLPESRGLPRMLDVHSPRTDRTFRFTLQATLVRKDEVQGWSYRPIAKGCPVIEMLVLND